MDFKKGFASGVFTLSIVALIFSVVTGNPTDAASEGMSGHGSTEKSESSSRIEDAHRRFRDGSMGGMMGSMMGKHGSSESDSQGKSPHGAKSGGASPHGKSSGHGSSGMSSSSHGGRSALFSAAGLKGILGLDEKQTASIKTVLSEYRKATILTKAHLRVAQMELDETVADADFKVSDIEAKAKKREAIATELTMVRVKALAGARDVLDGDQFKTFMGMLVRHMSSHGKKGNHAGSGGHGMRSGKHGGSGSGYSGSHGKKSGHGGSSSHGFSGMSGRHSGGSENHGKSDNHHESVSQGQKSSHGYDD